MLTDKGCSCTSSWGKSVVLALSYINYRLVSWNAQLFINAQSQQLFPTSRCSAANSLPPKPFYDNPVSKRKLPVCNNWRRVFQMPGYTLTLQPVAIHTSLFTHHCYPILLRRFGVHTLPQAGSLEACLCPFSYEEMLHFSVLIIPRRLVTFVSDLFNFNPVWTSPWGPPYSSMLSRRNESASGYLFLLFKQAGDRSSCF